MAVSAVEGGGDRVVAKIKDSKKGLIYLFFLVNRICKLTLLVSFERTTVDRMCTMCFTYIINNTMPWGEWGGGGLWQTKVV